MPPEKKRQLRPCAICPYRGTSGLFTFPADQSLCEKWKALCKKDSLKTSDKICMEHFVDSDFLPMTVNHERQKLKPGAIPSQKLPSKIVSNQFDSSNQDHSYSVPEGKVPKLSPKQATQTELETHKLKKQLSNAYDRIDTLQRKLNLVEKQNSTKTAKEKIVKDALGDRLTPAQLDILLHVSFSEVLLSKNHDY